MNARVEAYVALGANLGDRRRTLEAALADLARAPGVSVVRRSAWYDTAPVGGPADQPRFLNGVAQLATELAPRDLLRVLQRIEIRFGRTRSVRQGPRTLDLDLLLYGDARIAEPDLVVPHPSLEDRAFVLEPLNDVAPDLVLPRTRLTARRRLRELGAEPARGVPACPG